MIFALFLLSYLSIQWTTVYGFDTDQNLSSLNKNNNVASSERTRETRSLFVLDYSSAFSTDTLSSNVTNATTETTGTIALDNPNFKEDFSPLVRNFKLNQKQSPYESSFSQLREVNLNAAHLKGKSYVNSEWQKSVLSGKVSLTSVFHKALRSSFEENSVDYDTTYANLVEYIQNLIASGSIHTVLQYSNADQRIPDTLAYMSANYSSLITSILVNIGNNANANHFVKTAFSGVGSFEVGEYEEELKESRAGSLFDWYSKERALASPLPANLYNLIENNNEDGVASTFLSGSFNCFQLLLDLNDLSDHLLPLEFERFLGKVLCRCQGTILKRELPETPYFSYWSSLSSLVSNAVATVSSDQNNCNITLDDGKKLFEEELPYRLKSLYYVATRESDTSSSILVMQGLLPVQSILNSNLHIASQASIMSATLSFLSKKSAASPEQANEILSATFLSGSTLIHSDDINHPILKRKPVKINSSSSSSRYSSSYSSRYSSSYSSKSTPTSSPTAAPTTNISASDSTHTSRHLASRDYSLDGSDINQGVYTFSQWELTDTSENDFDLVAKSIDEDFARNSSLTYDLSM